MKKDSRKYNIYHGVMAGGRWVLFAIVSFIILFPVYWIFISSITPSGELFKTPIDYLPDHPTLESYKFLIENVGLLSKVGNTVLIVGLTLVISTVLCAMAAYGFSRFTTKGINIAFAFIIATMLIPEVVTLSRHCVSSRSRAKCGCAPTASMSSTGCRRAGPEDGSAGAGKKRMAPLP